MPPDHRSPSSRNSGWWSSPASARGRTSTNCSDVPVPVVVASAMWPCSRARICFSPWQRRLVWCDRRRLPALKCLHRLKPAMATATVGRRRGGRGRGAQEGVLFCGQRFNGSPGCVDAGCPGAGAIPSAGPRTGRCSDDTGARGGLQHTGLESGLCCWMNRPRPTTCLVVLCVLEKTPMPCLRKRGSSWRRHPVVGVDVEDVGDAATPASDEC